MSRQLRDRDAFERSAAARSVAGTQSLLHSLSTPDGPSWFPWAPTSILRVLDPKVFKAYDVRGIYPDQLDEAGAYAIGRAYVEEFEPRTIAVGRDMRLSSPSMAGAIMRGAADVGADVVDLGLVGTEMVYFAVGELDLEGGVMVTASHNPGEYTGMKIVRRGALPVGGDSGLLEIRTRAMSLDDKARGQTQGHVRREDIWRRWVDAVLSFIEVDEVEFVPGDFVTALLAEAILEKEPGAKILYDVRASWAVPETIRKAGGTPLVNRVGHAFFKHRMREEGAAFGGEVSGHYYFRDFSQADSGVIPFLLMLELVSKRGRELSEILAPYRERYFITGELNTPVTDVALKLQELKERFGAEGNVSHLDGLSVDAKDWHMNVRPSNTEPLLRLNLEAISPDLMERKRDEVLDVIRK